MTHPKDQQPDAIREDIVAEFQSRFNFFRESQRIEHSAWLTDALIRLETAVRAQERRELLDWACNKLPAAGLIDMEWVRATLINHLKSDS